MLAQGLSSLFFLLIRFTLPVFSVRFVYDLITCRVHPFLPYVHLCPTKCALLLSMTPFKHSCFLCCSMSSFGVSTTSPKKSSSFNIFIKCGNWHHMKNNIRYKGNINKTSVVIFLIRSWLKKTPTNDNFLEEPPGGFPDAGCCCCLLHGRFFIPSPFRELLPVFTPILYFEPNPSQSDSRHFHFIFSRILIFTASATALRGRFLPTGVFYPTLLRLWLRCRQEHPIQSLPLCLPSQSCPFRLAYGLELLMLELQDHWFINCTSEPRSIELKLNYWIYFACSFEIHLKRL